MEKSDLTRLLKQFESSLERLDEVLQKDIKKDNAFLDAAIQRFEFCYELSWKTLRRFLAAEGIEANTPRETFKQAFKLGWLSEGDKHWSQMIEDRNQTSHTYNLKTAMAIYAHLKSYMQSYRVLLGRLKKS